MNSKKAIFSIFYLFVCTSVVYGQGVRIADPTVLFEQNIAYSNASQLETWGGWHLGNQSQFGAFSEIVIFYGFGSLPIGKNKTQGVGLGLYSSQEGELIAENRLKLSFWKKIALNDRLDLIAGGQAGLINTSFKATRSTAGANAWTPNFDFGLTIKNKFSSLAVSINQLNNPNVQPLTQAIAFKNFWTFLVSHSIRLNENLQLNMFGYGLLVDVLPNIYQVKAMLDIEEKFNVGLGGGTEGVVVSAGMDITPQIMFHLAYLSPVFTQVANNYQPFQLHLTFKPGL